MAITPNEDYNDKTPMRKWYPIIRDNLRMICNAINGWITNITNHIADKGNPHGVTKSQVGLSNVDNLQQATKSEFDTHRMTEILDHPDGSVTAPKIKNDEIGDDKLQYITVVDEITDNGFGGAPGIGQRRGKPLSLLTVLYRKVAEHISSYKGHRSATTLDHPDGSVTTEKIAPEAVTTGNIAQEAVDFARLSYPLQQALIQVLIGTTDGTIFTIDPYAENELFKGSIFIINETGRIDTIKKGELEYTIDNNGFTEVGEREETHRWLCRVAEHALIGKTGNVQIIQQLDCLQPMATNTIYVGSNMEYDLRKLPYGYYALTTYDNVIKDGAAYGVPDNFSGGTLLVYPIKTTIDDNNMPDDAGQLLYTEDGKVYKRVANRLVDTVYPWEPALSVTTNTHNERYVYCDGNNDAEKINKAIDELDAMASDGSMRTIHIVGRCVLDAAECKEYTLQDGSKYYSIIKPCYNVIFEGVNAAGVVFDGTNATQIEVGEVGYPTVGRQYFLFSGDNLQFKNCTFTEVNCTDATNFAAFASPQNGLKIEDCVFTQMHMQGWSGSWGYIYSSGDNIILERNRFENIKVSCDNAAKNVVHAANGTVQNNVFSGWSFSTLTGVQGEESKITLIVCKKTTRNTIKDFTVSDNRPVEIQINTTGGESTENTIKNITTGGNGTKICFKLYGGNDAKVVNNTIDNVTPSDMLIYTNLRAVCKNNWIKNIKNIEEGTILIRARASLVSGNYVYLPSAVTPDTIYYGISNTANGGYTRICDNHFQVTAGKGSIIPINTSGANCIVTNNTTNTDSIGVISGDGTVQTNNIALGGVASV